MGHQQKLNPLQYIYDIRTKVYMLYGVDSIEENYDDENY